MFLEGHRFLGRTPPYSSRSWSRVQTIPTVLGTYPIGQRGIDLSNVSLMETLRMCLGLGFIGGLL